MTDLTLEYTNNTEEIELRPRVENMTDRDIAVETLVLLRGLSDGLTMLMNQVGPVIEQMQNSPFGRMFGGK